MTTDGKTIAERLRNIDEPLCPSVRIRLALEGKPAFCEDTLCDECYNKWFGKLADAIEADQRGSKSTPLPEGIEWPRFEDGELVKIGDEFEGLMGTSTLSSVELSHRGAWLASFSDGGSRYINYGEPVKRPDTFESVVGEMLADFGSSDSIELDGYFNRLRKLLGGE